MSNWHINPRGRFLPCKAKYKCAYGGTYTKEQEEEVCKVLDQYQDIVGYEEQITKDLQDLGLSLYNLDHRRKTCYSTVDKVLHRGKDIHKLYDIIRYTSVSNEQNYYGDFAKTISILTQKGYRPIEITDFWKMEEESRRKGGYKGINIKMENPDGVRFELQFHTKESLFAKEEAHRLYETARNPKCDEKERENATRQMFLLFAHLNTPKDKHSTVDFTPRV